MKKIALSKGGLRHPYPELPGTAFGPNGVGTRERCGAETATFCGGAGGGCRST